MEPMPEVRFVDSIQIGQYARQGDLYLLRIDEVPKGLKTTPTRQLAPGSTMGSRHTVGSGVTVYESAGQVQRNELGYMLAGPVIESPEHITVEHPEHAHISLPPGIYQVCYQVDVRTMRRVED